ncbi:MAG: CBS domain-containing protein [Desulfuromonadales bacterium C00003068]|jgi:acetoin utilization protein AcuB|nr:MAG: CBS domain-containing protein [Desulfuromonadales bacterium C00003068]
MKIEEIMSTRVVTVELDDSLSVVKELFDKTGFHHLLVVEDDRLCGVISDRDLLKALSPALGTIAEKLSDRENLKKKVHQVMSRKPTCLMLGATVVDAVSLFNANTVTCIPVIDILSRPVGIVSWRDIMKRLILDDCGICIRPLDDGTK